MDGYISNAQLMGVEFGFEWRVLAVDNISATYPGSGHCSDMSLNGKCNVTVE